MLIFLETFGEITNNATNFINEYSFLFIKFNIIIIILITIISIRIDIDELLVVLFLEMI